tara:strand:- start:3051 stop:3236 length:186 start_codon:yes stop_codon:yes gene_type:complete
MYTILNEIDNRIYNGTPVFKTAFEAITWWQANSGRPSDVVVSLESMGSAKDLQESVNEFFA